MRLFQNESSCKTFHKKDMFDLHEKEPVVGTHFHMNGFEGRLILTKVNSEMACLDYHLLTNYFGQSDGLDSFVIED